MLEPLTELSTDGLRSLASSFHHGAMAQGLSEPVLFQIAGVAAGRVRDCLDNLASNGMSPQHIAVLLQGMLAERVKAPDLASLFELVLSGPEIHGVPTRDTGAAIVSLIQEAEEEIVLSTYVLHNTAEIFREIAEQQRRHPALRVIFFVHIARPIGDTSAASEIASRFGRHFREQHWPWAETPAVFFDPRGLNENASDRATLHAKCIVVDRKSALITSANFTEAARTKNIELGILIRHPSLARRTADYFVGLANAGILRSCPIPSLKL